MLVNLFQLKRLEVSHSLYPATINWNIRDGINVIVGGTGLGKTTLVNAILFTLFGDLGKSSNRETEHITSRYFSERSTSDTEPYGIVEASFSGHAVYVKRSLRSGRLLEVLIDNAPCTPKSYKDRVAALLQLTDFDNQLMRLVDHLLYVGESHYLLSWDNQLQNEIITLLFSDPSVFTELNTLWEKAQSYDSSFRNLRAQAYRLEKELAKSVNNPKSTLTDDEIGERRTIFEDRLRNSQEEYSRLIRSRKETQATIKESDASLAELYKEYDALSKSFSDNDSPDIDTPLISKSMNTNDQKTIYSALADLGSQSSWICPCCSRDWGTQRSSDLTRISTILQQSKCPICAASITLTSESSSKPLEQSSKQLEKIMNEIRNHVLIREKARSRMDAIIEELEKAAILLEDVHLQYSAFSLKHPINIGNNSDSKRVAIAELRSSSRAANLHAKRFAKQFQKKTERQTELIGTLHSEIAKAFGSYGREYLDEECTIRLDKEAAHAQGKLGAQIKAPHASFYPVISGVARLEPKQLSEAQRLFMDLAFRMALLTVWTKRTTGLATLFIETPEGATDLAYMKRVASMLKVFASSGHSLVITTNINNDAFLPALLSQYPANERPSRVLNMLECGRPHKVQRQEKREFSRVLRKAYNRRQK